MNRLETTHIRKRINKHGSTFLCTYFFSAYFSKFFYSKNEGEIGLLQLTTLTSFFKRQTGFHYVGHWCDQHSYNIYLIVNTSHFCSPLNS